MSRLKTKRIGLDALRLLCYENPDGIVASDAAKTLGRHRTIIFHWLKEIGAVKVGDGTWVLIPSNEDIRMAKAVLKAAKFIKRNKQGQIIGE